MSFDDLFDFNGDSEEQVAELREEEIWDTEAVWDTGELPAEVWTVN